MFFADSAGSGCYGGGMSEILQKTIPYDVTSLRRLPGIQPLAPEDWLIRDDAFAGQMARRDDLLATRREAVISLDDSARAAALELLALILANAYPEAAVGAETVTRPDAVVVPIDRDDPMGTIGRLAQEDFLILQRPEGAGEHVLTAGVLVLSGKLDLGRKVHDAPDAHPSAGARLRRQYRRPGAAAVRRGAGGPAALALQYPVVQ